MKKTAAFILLVLAAISCTPASSVKEETFGILSDGRVAHLYTLENASGAKVQLSDYGARIVSICVPDKNGRLLDVVTGPGELKTFESRDRFMGCIVGRYGNRIDGAEFSLDGIRYTLDANEYFGDSPVHIHGGGDGFDRKIWGVTSLSEPGRTGVRMEYLSPDGEMGYPGNLNASVTYWWTDDNVLSLEYEATTDKPTVVNLSNHTYFNLGGQDRYVMEQLLQVNADEYIQNNTHFCPDLVLPVDDSPFDFREPHRVDYRIDMPNAHLSIMHGMSACWPVRGYDGSIRKACRLYSEQSGIALSCWTTEPYLLTYTARGFDGSIPGKYGPLEKFSGMLLETTHAADSPNQDRFPSVILRPGEKYTSVTEFRFGREDMIPTPVFDARPEYVDLYWTAWRQAEDHIKYQRGLPQPRYMDEGLWDDAVWIWDSAFMVLFCKYAPKLFPGIETLDNFYYTLHENAASPLSIWHPDNPPLFAWVESDYYNFTADKAHIKELIKDKRFLQKHFELFNTMDHDTRFPFPISNDGVRIKYKGIGYNWQGWQSGMDNTPRKRAMPMFWIDAISQQALSALYISRLARVAGDAATEREFTAKYEELKEKINNYYWDGEDGCYYDIREGDLSKTRILTPASFWPMLAEIPSQEQADAMVRFALRDDKLGGVVPWPSVSRDDPEFDPDGNYWKGSMWLPTAYMGIKALEKYGYFDLANRMAAAVLEHMWQTYSTYSPHTIWECYSPTKAEPGSKKAGPNEMVKTVAPDFCGWSALGPISLFIENVIGFYGVDAPSSTVRWNLHHSCRHGIKNLSFGKITADIMYDSGRVTVVTNKPFTLYINGTRYSVRRGINRIEIGSLAVCP